MSIVYLNGEFCDQAQASVSVLDRGFLLGDGVYEVIPAYQGNLFRLEEHLDRLANSLDAIGLANPHSHAQWRDILQQLVDRNGHSDLSVYLQLTRGVAKRDHAFPANTPPTVFAMANAITPPDDSIRENGIAAITAEDDRWHHCNIKAISLLPNVLLRQKAVDAGVSEAILIRDGLVTEGAASNLFIWHQNQLCTPPKSDRLLPGITRDLVLELARESGLNCNECDIPLETLREAQEIWLTSSTKEILPVTRLDDQPVGAGKPGTIWQKILAKYQEYKANYTPSP